MSPHRADYDALASTYDERYETGGAEQVALALLTFCRQLEAGRVLEIACGTGHWLARLRPLLPGSIQLHGSDLSSGMLSRARQKSFFLRLARARAELQPYASSAFDRVFCAYAIHHFTDGKQFVQEAYRLLRPGGALAVINTVPHNKKSHWYIYDYFESTLQTDLDHFPSLGTISDWMISAGFNGIRWQTVYVIRQNFVGASVFEDHFLQKSACSQLAGLSQEAYQAGLERIHKAVEAAEHAGESLVFSEEIPVEMIWAVK